MNRSIISKVILIAMGSLFVTGCVLNTSDAIVQNDQNKNDGSTVTSDANKASEPVNVASGGPLGGYIEQFMDANDKSKMVRAMDGGLGKAVRWKNPVSGADFAVTPVSKASINGGICRNYYISMIKTGIADKVSGTACIGEDGVWHSA